MSRLSYDRYFTELDAETERLAAVVRATDPSHPVPTCPQWSFTDLATHVGRGHRWAAMLVQRRATGWISQDEVEDGAAPGTATENADWLLAGGRGLAAAIREAGPAATVWTWAEEQTAGFWLRRITHDTLIHRFDAELAAGRPGPLAPDLAADGVSDLLDCIAILSDERVDPIFAGLRGDGETLHFHATDEGLGSDGEWLVRRLPERVQWEHGHRKADVAVRGPAAGLLLALNRRATGGAGVPGVDVLGAGVLGVDVPGVDVFGDKALFEHWLRHSAF